MDIENRLTRFRRDARQSLNEITTRFVGNPGTTSDKVSNSDMPKPDLLPGTMEALSELLAKEPQTDSNGQFRYLLTGGIAVELITESLERPHHDIDLVICDENVSSNRFGADNVTPKWYWAGMCFGPSYLQRTAWTAMLGDQVVHTVHPGIILVQKLTNALGIPPREIDVRDVVELSRYWQEDLGRDPKWYPVLREALAAIPRSEQSRSAARVDSFIPDARLSHRKGIFGVNKRWDFGWLPHN